jgi:acetate kinase
VQGEEAFISYPHSPVKVMVIPTDEEVMIARDVTRLANI